MSVEVSWDPEAEQPPARVASWRSMNAVASGRKSDWIALFAEDAVVEDPVGVSFFDPDGLGHRGHDAIGAFWDKTIAQAERLTFVIRDSHAAGSECANVGTITAHLANNYVVDTDGVFVYRVDDSGLVRSVRAFWEPSRAVATTRQV